MYPGWKVYGLILLFKKIKKICTECVYRSPSAPSLNDCEIHLKIITDEMSSTVSSDLIIIRDFNFPLIEWVDGLGHVVSNNGDSPFVSCLSDNFF